MHVYLGCIAAHSIYKYFKFNNSTCNLETYIAYFMIIDFFNNRLYSYLVVDLRDILVYFILTKMDVG
jgi:hypothetical protein